MILNIYRGASVNLSVHIDDKTIFIHKLNGERYIDSSFNSVSALDLRIGDYIIHNGENFYINRDPNFKKSGSRNNNYTVRFESSQYELKKVAYNTVSSVGYIDGISEFYLFGKAQMFLNLIVSNMNRDRSGWTVGTVADTKEINLYFNNENCLSVLNRLCSEFSLEFEVVGKQISLKQKLGTTTALNLKYGKYNGLYSISRENTGTDYLVTRLKAFGSDRNLLYSYRNHSERLKFVVGGKSYVEKNVAQYGVVESSVTWDDIFPHRTGTLSSIGADIYTFSDSSIDFDINGYLLPGITPKIHFQTGDCAGYEFEIAKFDNTAKEITIIKVADSQGFEMPNATLKPKVGDTYVIIDIQMPQSYIDAAETELYNRAVNYLDTVLCVPPYTYSLAIDRLYTLSLGMGDELTISDTELGINNLVRVIGIQYPINDFRNLKIDLSNKVSSSKTEKLFVQLEDQKRTNNIIVNDEIPKAVRQSVLAIQSLFLLKYTEGSPGVTQHVYSDVFFHGNVYAQGNISAYTTDTPPLESWWLGMPKASATVVGGVKIGANLSIDAYGVLSSTASGGVSSWNDLLDKPAIHQHTETFDFTSRTITLNREAGKANIKGGSDGYVIIDANGAAVSINHYVNALTYLGVGGGKVTIGTQTPSNYKLTVEGDSITSGWIRSKTAGYGWYNEATSTGIYSPSNGIVKVYNGGNLYVGGAIDSIGGVNLVKGASSQTGYIEFKKSNDVRVGYIGWYPDRMYYHAEIGHHEFIGGIQTNKYCYCYNNGRGSIQITTEQGSLPGYSSDYYPTLKSSAALYFSANGVYSGYFQNLDFGVYGNITANGNVSAYSDRSLKTNLKPLTNVLDTLADINGYTYTRTDLKDKEKVHLGLIAQEVEKHYPQLVEENKETKIKSLNYQAFTAVLLEAIKEQQKRIENQQIRIEDLERRVK